MCAFEYFNNKREKKNIFPHCIHSNWRLKCHIYWAKQCCHTGNQMIVLCPFIYFSNSIALIFRIRNEAVERLRFSVEVWQEFFAFTVPRHSHICSTNEKTKKKRHTHNFGCECMCVMIGIYIYKYILKRAHRRRTQLKHRSRDRLSYLPLRTSLFAHTPHTYSTHVHARIPSYTPFGQSSIHQ